MIEQHHVIKTLTTAIQKHFKRLDETVEQCDKLKEVREEYFKALRESNHDIGSVNKNKSEYEQRLEDVSTKLRFLQQDISSYCNEYKTLEPLTIGVFGEWGSGKTHILKGIKEQIELSQESAKKLWEDTPNPDKPLTERLIVPIFFNAWRFEKEEHIIIPPIIPYPTSPNGM